MKETFKNIGIVTFGIAGIIVLIYVAFKTIPTPPPLTPQDMVNELKLCQENGLDAYQVENGNWYCKPKK